MIKSVIIIIIPMIIIKTVYFFHVYNQYKDSDLRSHATSFFVMEGEINRFIIIAEA